MGESFSKGQALAIAADRYLGACGYVTRWAIDGPSALRLAETFTPEVAILDIGLFRSGLQRQRNGGAG